MSRARRRNSERREDRRTGARTVLVLFFCAGIALLGLLAGGEHRAATARLGRNPMVGYYPKGMPHYPRVQELPAGRDTRVGGSQVRMSYFTTEDDPAKVAEFYGERWRQKRYHVRDDVTHVGGVVSAVDAENGRIYQVLITVKQGRTVVFPSMTVAPGAAMDQPKQPPPVPLFPESTAVVHLASTEGSVRSRVILSVNDGGLEANVGHYERALRAAGYRPESSEQKPLGPEHRVLLYRKEGSEVTINLSAMSAKRVRVHMMVVES